MWLIKVVEIAARLRTAALQSYNTNTNTITQSGAKSTIPIGDFGNALVDFRYTCLIAVHNLN